MPWLYRIFDVITIDATRPFFTQVSRAVKNLSGFWFHPSLWQMLVALFAVTAGYWVYVAARTARG